MIRLRLATFKKPKSSLYGMIESEMAFPRGVFGIFTPQNQTIISSLIYALTTVFSLENLRLKHGFCACRNMTVKDAKRHHRVSNFKLVTVKPNALPWARVPIIPHLNKIQTSLNAGAGSEYDKNHHS